MTCKCWNIRPLLMVKRGMINITIISVPIPRLSYRKYLIQLPNCGDDAVPAESCWGRNMCQTLLLGLKHISMSGGVTGFSVHLVDGCLIFQSKISFRASSGFISGGCEGCCIWFTSFSHQSSHPVTRRALRTGTFSTCLSTHSGVDS